MVQVGIEKKFTNNLKDETSPYLLQHKNDPVNWYPWNRQTFDLAKQQDKPIFLSIGYSACHWCHVMQKESFKNENIAEILNKNYISIKVDREQRPDIDNLYMNSDQLMTGNAGWPATVFLTPDAKPFYGGTYFPPKSSGGRPGLNTMLKTIANIWQHNKDDIESSAGRISEALRQIEQKQQETDVSENLLEKAYRYYEQQYDMENGGFERAPKFPRAGEMSLMLAYWARTRDYKALGMVGDSIDKITSGGIYDHLGGGIHRYSVDQQWRIPHFEKMLYDQAMMARTLAQMWQITRDDNYISYCRDIFDYTIAHMQDRGGGFYSSEDADTEGREGYFYTWTKNEIESLLDDPDFQIFENRYGVAEKGSFENGRNVLYINRSIKELAEQFEASEDEIESSLDQSMKKLFAYRQKRVKPALDTKIITAWNGMMVSSLSYAGAVFFDSNYVSCAQRCCDFVLQNLITDGRLMRSYREGSSEIPGYLDDYAMLIDGLIELYQADFNPDRLDKAVTLAEDMLELFRDEKEGGFFMTGKDVEDVFMKTRQGYDGATPSGASVAALNLLRLGRITERDDLFDAGREVIDFYSRQLNSHPQSFHTMISAVNYQTGPNQEIIIAGDIGDSSALEMLHIIRDHFLPESVLLYRPTEMSQQLQSLRPGIENQKPIGPGATVYVCSDHTCEKPITESKELRELFDMKYPRQYQFST